MHGAIEIGFIITISIIMIIINTDHSLAGQTHRRLTVNITQWLNDILTPSWRRESSDIYLLNNIRRIFNKKLISGDLH